MLIQRECGNLKGFVGGGELARILTKRRSQAFYKLTDVHSVTNVLGKIISSRKFNLLDFFNKHVEYWETGR